MATAAKAKRKNRPKPDGPEKGTVASNADLHQRQARSTALWVLICFVTMWWCAAVVLTWQRPIFAPVGEFDHVVEPIESLKIDLNQASAAELRLLPGIGPTLSHRIFEDREAHGPFQSWDDLERVPGIGPRTVESLKANAILSTEEE